MEDEYLVEHSVLKVWNEINRSVWASAWIVACGFMIRNDKSVMFVEVVYVDKENPVQNKNLNLVVFA